MQEWKAATIEREELEFKGSDIFAFGPDLILRKCTLKFNCSRNALIFSCTKFYDCDITITKKLKDESWQQVLLEGCRFFGEIHDHSFGRPPVDRYWKEAGIQRCDFSGAKLYGCRFYNADYAET